MKGVVRVGKWRPIVGVCCLGMAYAGLSLQLEGALPTGVKPSATQPAGGAPSVQLSNEALWARAGQIPASGLPVFPPQVVDWADDEPTRLRRAGLLQGALPLPSANVVAGGCTFDIECEDTNPCTTDVCVIDVADGPGSGVCENNQVVAGQPGGCDNGLFCDGEEFCNGAGMCQDGPDPTCCSDPAEVCSNNLGRCPDDSPNPGDLCSNDGQCNGFKCEHCQPVCSSDAQCSDGKACNGVETCSGGQCVAGIPFCGAGALCSENRCIGQVPVRGCISADDCNGGIACNNSAGPLCFRGRCCTNVVEPVCSARTLNQGAPATTCQGTSSKWFPGDLGSETGVANTCGGVNPNNLSVQLGCPKYSSGIEQLTAASPPAHPVFAGPMSASMLSIAAPNGPGTALNRLGDDYTFTNSSHIALSAIRFVGFMSVADAIFIEFWDANGTLIEDFLFRPGTGPGVNVVYLEQPLVIPSTGRIAAVNKREFGMNSKFIWLSASSATTGTNNSNVLFVNNDPSASNFMAPSPGILSFELVGAKVPAPLGGCCKSDGTCTNELDWICDQLNGSFQGVGNFCNICENGDNAGASCGVCVGGGNDGDPCNGSNECADGSCEADDTVCNAGSDTCSNNGETICTIDANCPALPNVCSNADLSCVLSSDCPAGGTCGGAGTCEEGTCAALDACGTGACCDTVTGDCSQTTMGGCSGNFQGLGTGCEPNCCVQPSADTNCTDGACYTGADNCSQAFVHPIPALPCLDCGPGGSPSDIYTVTITGDRTFASATEANPDSCWGVAEDVQSDLGWWEAFSLTGDCTRVRFDYCCTSPTQFGDWAFVAKDCGCVDIQQPRPDPNLESAGTANRGAPYCAEDNVWVIMGLMGPGTYYIPVNSTLEDELGDYQLHIVAEACPTAACCKPDGSCEDGLNQFECDAEEGTFLSPPQRFPSVAVCTPGICDTGSCCIGPGECEDEILGDAIDLADCNSLTGNFIGGLRCEGGSCADDAAFSCNDPADCSEENGGPDGLCDGGIGGARSLAQPNPCPVCEFEGAGNCNLWDNPAGFNGAISELSLGSGLVAADDFIPAPGVTSITSVCAWGFYFIKDPNDPNLDCGPFVTEDHFRVRVYANSDIDLPGAIVGSSETSSTKAIIPGAASLGVGPGYETYGYQMVLDTPIVGLVPGDKYWLEISNDLAIEDGCFWFWSFISDESGQGNDFFAGGSTLGYQPGAQRGDDLAFCINGNYDTPDEPIRPCCTCGGQCLSDTVTACNAAVAEYHIEAIDEGTPLACDSEFTCPANGSPVNDDCENASEIYIGNTPVSVLCSTTDGINPVAATEEGGGNFILGFDVWYTFETPENCSLLRVDMCASGDSYDSALSVYSNGSNTCVCPTTQAVADATILGTGDESCASGVGVGGAAFLEFPATPGQCFMIRVGEFCSPCAARGTALIDISCGDPICGNNATEPSNGEECDGADDDDCPGACNPVGHPSECMCGDTPTCGDNVREGNEECDGTDSAECPGLCISAGNPNECTCTSLCGNGIREGVEQCDGPADESCGGEAGRCLVDCTCPPVDCGNDFTDPGEECDGDDDEVCPGECRAPGDPAGECTCECGVQIVAPDPVTAESPAVGKVRHISFVVPATSAGTDTALRVQLGELNRLRVCCSGQDGNGHGSGCGGTSCYLDSQCSGGTPLCRHSSTPTAPNFSALEDQFRYVNSFSGGSTTCVDSNTFATNFRCGQLGCQPEYRDWATALASATNPASPAGLIHVTGEAVVPSSTLSVGHIAATCGAAPSANTCASASTNTAVTTSRWGDVGSGGGGGPDGNTNVIDIGLVVDNVKGLATAIPERRAWMKNPPNTFLNPVNVIDIGLTVDSVKGLPYPYTIAACP